MSESNVYELLTQYAEGTSVNETSESLNALMQENPAAFLSELQQIITNESLPPIIIANAFVFLKHLYSCIEHQIVECSEATSEEKINEIIEICSVLMKNENESVYTEAGITIGILCQQFKRNDCVETLINFLLNPETVEQQKSSSSALKEVIPYVTFDTFAPFTAINEFVINTLPENSYIEVIFDFFITMVYTIPYALDEKALTYLIDFLHSKLSDGQYHTYILKFFKYIAKKKPYVSKMHFPEFIQIFVVLMKAEQNRQDLLITMKRILKDFNSDYDFIKLEGFDENCSEIMQAIIIYTDENSFSLTTKVLKLFVEALNVEQIQGLVDLVKEQMSEYTQVYQIASALYFFSKAMKHSFDLDPFIEIIGNEEFIAESLKQHVISQYTFYLLGTFANKIENQEEVDEPIQLILNYLDLECDQEQFTIAAKIDCFINTIRVCSKTHNVDELIEIVFQLCESITSCEEIHPFTYFAKLISFLPIEQATAAFCMAFDNYRDAEDSQFQKELVFPILQYIKSYPPKFVEFIGDVIPVVIDVVESGRDYASESICILWYSIQQGKEAYEPFFEKTIEIAKALIESSESNPSVDVLYLVDNLIKAKEEFIDESIVSLLCGVASNESANWQERGVAVLALYHVFLKNELIPELVELLNSLCEMLIHSLTNKNIEEAEDLICGVLGLMRRYIMAGNDEFVTQIIELLNALCIYEWVSPAIILAFLESCFTLIIGNEEAGKEILSQEADIMKYITIVSKANEPEMSNCKEIAKTILSYFQQFEGE